MIIKNFEEQVVKFSEKLAVVTDKHQLTYRQLNNYANGIAGAILDMQQEFDKSKLKKKMQVGLLFEHSADMIVSVLAALKAGKTYIPLDITYPGNRLEYMLQNSQAYLLLTNTLNWPLAQKLASEVDNSVELINIDTLGIDIDTTIENIPRSPSAEKAAYILYTSGSTGKPKGVVQDHENVCYYIRNWTERFSITSSDRMTLFTAFSHDGAVQDMFGALHNGATLYPYNILTRTNIAELAQWLIDEKITIWHSVPTLYRYFVDTLKSRNAAAGNFPDIRFVLLGGEPIRNYDIEMFKTYFPDAAFANVYGQTESSVSTIWIVGTEDRINKMLIGTPLDNTRVLIINDRGEIIDSMGVGEIYICCPHIALGYWKDKKNTTEVFLRDADLGKLYRTGDLGRLTAKGDIEIVGRKDSQVKIRGFRIEVGEIETVLLKHEAIREVAVMVNNDEDENAHLCAYYVLDPSGPGKEALLTVSDLRAYLSTEVPEYMIPSHFMQLEKLPLTPNGKVDRKKLPQPEHIRPQLEVTYVEPENEMDKKISRIWADVLNLDKVGVHDNFFDLGGTSLDILKIMAKLYEEFNRDVPVVSVFRYPTIREFVDYLNQEETDNDVMVTESETETDRVDSTKTTDVAVIGVSPRFPGGENIHEFWEALKNGVETIGFYNDQELMEEARVHPRALSNPNYVRARGIINDIEFFDAGFFNYTPLEAEVMDPQLRIMHECCWDAMENAAYDPETYKGLIGLYAGNANNATWLNLINLSNKSLVDQGFLTNNYSVIVSYKLDLRGPSFILQTACSTSLVAVHLACQGLNNHECDMALAGGVSIWLPNKNGYFYQEGMLFSKDGHCRTFDAKAKGAIFGNGAGMVLLKRLEEAVADNDHIYAVIKGSGINNDGRRKVGLPSPSIEGQAEVVRKVYRETGIDPESISYVEAHGTGTAMGDPIELEALRLGFNTTRTQYCRIGSVKTNFGHLNIAAGIAGFIKTVLSIHHRMIPPSLNFETPNPRIDFEKSPFIVNTKLTEWKGGKNPLRAAVSAFGIGGTNAHVILEEAPPKQPSSQSRELQMLLLTARTSTALEKVTENLADYLSQNPGVNLADVAYTLQVGRKANKYRRMVLCTGIDEAVQLLKAASEAPTPEQGKPETVLAEEGERPFIFMFSGQGAQYVNMGLDLYRTDPLFKEEMDRCFSILKPVMGFDIKDILYPGPDAQSLPQIDQTEVTQPILFTIEYAMARLLMQWGIKPYAMLGHSIGEYVAACLSGVFSLEDALHLVAMRGKLMQKVPTGSMLSVSLPEDQLEPLLAQEDQLGIAAVNTTAYCVVSGPHQAVESFENRLKELGHNCKRLHTSHAFHSAMMDPILKEFEQYVSGIKLNKPVTPYLSNVTGKWIAVEDATSPGYWVRHLRGTVRLSDSLALLLQEPNAIFLEVGPGRTLNTFVRQHKDKKPGQLNLNLIRHPKETVSDMYYLVGRIGRIWLNGGKFQWQKFYTGETRHRIPLPTYPYEKKPYRLDLNLDDVGKMSQQDPVPYKRPNLEEWFYFPTWAIMPAAGQKSKKTAQAFKWLLFSDFHQDGNIGAGLRTRLETDGQEVVVVKPGAGFGKDGNNEYTINPHQDKDYTTLLDECCSEGKIPTRIIYMWSLMENQLQLQQDHDLVFHGLLYLVQAFGSQGIKEKIQITVLTDRMQMVTGEEEVHPLQALITGPVRVIPREYPNVTCRSIDIDITTFHRENPGEDALLSRILNEVSMDVTDTFIALRGNHRWVKRLESLPLEKPEEEARPLLKDGGVYLVTGGLGGIGLVLAEYLAKTVKAKLVLTGRTSLPNRDQWDQWFLANPGEDSTGLKIQKVRRLEALGAEVLVLSADAANKQQMDQVLKQASQRFGTINGVIHSAGVPDGGVIQRRDRQMTERVFNAKVTGTLVLNEILKNMKLDFFMLCSSITALTGTVGQVAYCAANAFMDSYAGYKTEKDKTFTVSVNWDAWQEVGMAVEAVKQLLGPGSKTVPENRVRDVDYPLFTGCEVIDSDHIAYISRLRVDTWWMLAEHRIMGKPTLPATGYLEMTRAAIQHHLKCKAVEITEFIVLTPLIVKKDEDKEVRIIFNKEDDRYGFVFISRVNPGEDAWMEHARGKALGLMENEPRKYPLAEIENSCNEFEINRGQEDLENTFTLERGALSFGPRWNNLQWIKVGNGQALGLLELPEEFSEDIGVYHMHPAVLDIGVTVGKKIKVMYGSYLPIFYKRMLIKGSFSQRTYFLSTPSGENKNDDETLKYNITIMDEAGNELAEVEEYTLRKVGPERFTARLYMDEEEGKAAPVNSKALGKPLSSFISTGNASTSSQQGVYNEYLKDAISSLEGVEAFRRILGWEGGTQVAVSTVDLNWRMKSDTRRRAKKMEEEAETGKRSGAKHSRPDLSTDYAAPNTEAEKALAPIWEDLLGIEPVGIYDDFFELGGDSLKAVNFGSRIRKELNTEVPISEFFNRPNIKLLGEFIQANSEVSEFSSIPWAEEKMYYPLSTTQRRLYLLARLEETTTAFNVFDSMTMNIDLDVEKVEEVFKQIVHRHESLRTSFHTIKGKPMQKIHPRVEFEIQYYDCTNRDGNTKPPDEIIRDFVIPFDLEKVPLLRAGYIKLAEKKYIQLLDVHHTVFDGTSYALFLKEFKALYNKEELPPLKVQYKDYSEWQNNRKDEDYEENARQEKYWLGMLSGELPVLQLPLDHPRPAIQNFEGNNVIFTIGKRELEGLRVIAKKEEVTMFMLLLAVYNILLMKLSGQEDILVGTAVAGRNHVELEPLIGAFVNTLVMRNCPYGQQKFDDFLKEVKNRTLAAFENQEYPFEDLVEKVAVNRDLSRNPIFDVTFSLNNEFQLNHTKQIDKAESYRQQKKASQFDLSFISMETDDVLLFEIEYCSKLFDVQTIKKYANYFKSLVDSIVENSRQELSGIEMIPEEERSRVLNQFNRTEMEYLRDKTIHELFGDQAAETPDRTVLVDEDIHVSYRELHEQSNQLARILRRKGVKNDALVGIMADPSVEVLTGILAILKAGGAYMVIDGESPRKRAVSLLKDCNSSVLLTNADITKKHSFTALQDLQSISVTPGRTAVRPQILDLDSMPMTDRSLVNYERFNVYIGQAMVRHSISLQATRGCPYKCAYCHKIWPKNHVVRSAENIFAELKRFYDIGVRRFAMIDDIFNLNVKNSKRFFELILENRLDVHLFFPNGIRGDILTKDYIDLMIKAGTVNFALALETASPRLQKLIGKNLNIEKLRENIEYITKTYPQVILELFTMHGFPSETQEEAMMTLDFIKSVKWLHFPYISILRVYPSTDMAKLALENGISNEAIHKSADLALHELPETLVFDKSFTLKYQADFFNEYFLSKERLLQVLPYQMKVLTEDEMVQKYNSYLPQEIHSFDQLLDFTGIKRDELGAATCVDEGKYEVPHLHDKMKTMFPKKAPSRNALRILLLDLSQFFSKESKMLYDVVEPPLGLMYLLTNLNQQLGGKINGKIAKSRIDFDSYEELKKLLDQFQPDVIGIRCLTFHRNFFHNTVSMIRNWGIESPIIAGGPYATSDYTMILKDRNIDLVVIGEGEVTFTELIGKMLENGGKLPAEEELEKIPGIAYVHEKQKITRQLGREIVLLDKLPALLNNESGDNLENINRPIDIAYNIFTSGSTGKPKGVMVQHQNVAQLMFPLSPLFDFDENDTWTLFHSLCFDFSVWEMYGALLFGGKLVIIPKMLARDTRRFLKILKEKNVTILNQTPSAFYNLIEEELHQQGHREKQLQLRYIIFGGEALNPGKLKEWHDTYPAAKLINMYGITETTVHVTFKEITPKDIEAKKSNIGQALPTLNTFVMDKSLTLLPYGIPGELSVGGHGVARGYLNRPELSREKFVDNPYKPEQKLYRSGDLVKQQENGDMEYLGRIDQQVKIRGYRVELGEIENHLMSFAGVKDAVVVANEDKLSNSKQLAAYITPDPEHAYPVVNMLELKEKGELTQHQTYELPNGKTVFCLNKSETEFMYDEIFDSNVYLKHGIKLEDGACIFDVGANIGLFSLFVGHLGKNVDIYAFEPIPPIFEVMSLNARIYGLNLKPFAYGIGREEENALFTYYPNASSLSGCFADTSQEMKTVGAFIQNQELEGETVSPEQVDELLEERLSQEHFRCPIKTLSQAIKETGVGKIDLLKIDVEKSELQVLNNIAEEDWPKIRQIVLEIHDIDGRLEMIRALLENRGYRVTFEQDQQLQNSLLYNMYALRPDDNPQQEEQEEENVSRPAHRSQLWSSPGRLIADLRLHLNEKLPDYMTPAYYVPLVKLPLTVNGKVDRKALPDPQRMNLEDEANFVPPSSVEEKILVEIWEKVLGGNKISVNDNFFLVGGDSIKSIQIISRMSNAGYKLEMKDLFQYPVISELAPLVKKVKQIPDTSVSEKLSVYANSKTFLKEKTYWQKIESVEVPPIPKDQEADDNDVKDTRSTSFTLGEEETERLLTKVNKVYKTEINDILLTALAMGINKTFGLDRVLIALENQEREKVIEDIDISRTNQWFNSVYPVLLDISRTDDTGGQVKEIKETLRRVPNKGIGYGILKHLTSEENKQDIQFKLKPQISFNYLQQPDANESPDNKESLKNRKEYEIDVKAITANNRITINLSYNEKYFKSETIAAFLSNFTSELKQIIEFCCSKEKIEPTPSDFTYKGLSIESIDRLMEIYPDLEDLYTLTPMQEGMLFHARMDDSSHSYFEQISYRLQGELDISLVEKSLNQLFKRHDILRTAFVYKNIEPPLQAVLKERTIDLYYEDIREIGNSEEKKNFIKEFKTKDRNQLFDLSQSVLMRVSIFRSDNSEYEFVWSFHHILMDGWCLGILNAEFFEIYTAYLENRPYQLPEVKPYRTYIQWLEKQEREESASYWQSCLDSFEEQTGVPRPQVIRKEDNRYQNETFSMTLDTEITAGLNKVAAVNQVTVNTLTQAVWAILLGKYNRKEDVVFGSVVSGRPYELEGVESMVGLFINTIPVRIRFEDRMKFNTLLRKIQEEAVASEPHHYHPLAKIQAHSQLKQNLIDHLYVFENLPITEQIEGYGAENNQSDQFSLKLTNAEAFDQTNYDFNIVLAGSDRLLIKFKYNANVYPNDYIERIAGHLLLAFRQVIENEELEIGRLTLLSEEEKKRLLYEFNDTMSEYPSDKTIHELFEQQAAQRPDCIAMVGPSLSEVPIWETDESPTQVSYRELNERSNGFAHWLKQEGVEPDTIVGIMVERSLEVIIGILGILKAGGAYLPIDTNYPQDRINYMLADSGAKIVVTTEYPANKLNVDNCQLLMINCQPEEPLENLSAGLRFPPAAGNLQPQLAYIIYTSGTTGKPKGMLIEHQNVVRLMKNDRFLFDFNHHDVWTMFHSYCFDFSVWEMYGALLYGGRLVMVPGTVSKDIIAYRRLLIKQGVTILNQTPSAFYHLAEEETFQYRKLLNIRVVIFGGEALNPVKLKKWKDKYPETKLVNMFGITETTVHVTYKEIGDKEIEFNISNIGKPIPTLNVYVVDEDQGLLPIGTPGELWVGGDGVGRGYLNRPELTAEKFVTSPYRDGERIYKSGDLGRWQVDEGDGDLVYEGRIDQQEKIRGFRVEPGEIEAQLIKHESIKEAVVISRNEEKGGRYLCAYMVPDTAEAGDKGNIPTPVEWREFLSKELPDYMIPSYFIPIDKVPLTANGKLDRRALPAPELKGKQRIAPRNEVERQLLEIWSEVLKVEKEKISIDSNFFDLGGHSLNATTVITKLHKAFNAKVPLVELFKSPTIQELAAYLEETSSLEARFSPIKPVEKKEYYPMSSGQRRMFTVQQMHRENVFANSTMAFKLEGAVDRQKFEEAFHKLIQRHESLKTSFFITGQEYRQKVHVDVPFKLEYTEVQHLKFPWEEASKIMEKFVRPFTLELTPLFRVGLVKVEKERFVLMIDMHHIITDGTSMKVFLGDLMALYDGQTLPPLPVQYKEFAHWQDQFIESGGMDLQETYWLKVFEKAPPELNLSTDFPRPDRLTAAGGFLTFRIDEEDINALRTMASQQDVTAFMILLAAFNVLLAKDSGEEDIVVGSPVASRRHEDSLKIIGIFSNFLALRNFPNKEKTFGEFLQEVKENTLAAFENQDYPFEELAKDEAVNPNRNPGRTPLFDVVFAFQNLRIPKIEIAGIQLKPFESKSKTARYDLEFQGFETENSMEFTVSYRLSLFREETVKRLIDSFKTILKQIPGSTDMKLAEIEIMTADEKNQVTLDFNIEKEREYDF